MPVHPVHSSESGPEYIDKNAPEERAQLAKNRARVEANRQGEDRCWRQDGAAPRRQAQTHRHHALGHKAPLPVAQKQNEKREKKLRREQRGPPMLHNATNAILSATQTPMLHIAFYNSSLIEMAPRTT